MCEKFKEKSSQRRQTEKREEREMEKYTLAYHDNVYTWLLHVELQMRDDMFTK